MIELVTHFQVQLGVVMTLKTLIFAGQSDISQHLEGDYTRKSLGIWKMGAVLGIPV